MSFNQHGAPGTGALCKGSHFQANFANANGGFFNYLWNNAFPSQNQNSQNQQQQQQRYQQQNGQQQQQQRNQYNNNNSANNGQKEERRWG